MQSHFIRHTRGDMIYESVTFGPFYVFLDNEKAQLIFIMSFIYFKIDKRP